MILIVDSGATKADWTAIDDSGEILFDTQTLGLNPEVLTQEVIMERITSNYQLFQERKNIKELYFYGAGCGTERMVEFIEKILEQFFINAKIEVREDTYAAVYATTDLKNREIVCILGTGSNCCMWDGEKLIQAVDSLGYIIMDECSGNYIGKKLISDYFFAIMPDDLREKMAEKYDLDSDVIKNHIYKLPNPNSYLAGFAKFLIENKDEQYCQDIFKEGMQLFIDHWIVQYPDYDKVPINFVGGIAFGMQDALKEILQENSLKIGKVLRRPIEGLVSYHIRNKIK